LKHGAIKSPGSAFDPPQQRQIEGLRAHVERCEDCAHERVAYNSCRNRHCPKCQGAAARQWVAEREAELLPAPYYHVVFTLPASIGAIAFQNKAAVYDLLFRTAAETLTAIAADPKHLGARIGLSPCCTPGARRSPIIRTSTSSFPAAACRWTDRAGWPASPTSSCLCACSRACSVASFSKASPPCTRLAASRFFGDLALLADQRAFDAVLTRASN
jgi:Transposase zinc-binding domain